MRTRSSPESRKVTSRNWDNLVTDREALFRAILANPDDDTLRLIYADSLEEANDTQRAAFIRMQVELAHVPDYDPSAIRFRFIDREKVFGVWLAEDLPTLAEGLSWSQEPYRRGLPAAIQAQDAATFVRYADELFSLVPIESLELSVARLTEVQGFVLSPWRDQLTHLSVRHGLGGHTARGLLGSTRYQRLKVLHIGGGLTTGGTASSVVRSQVFQQLTALSYRDDMRNTGQGVFEGGDTKFVNELIQLTQPPKLQKLDLSENRLTEEPVIQLLAAPILATVEDLDLSDNNLGSQGFRAIAAANLPNLRTLKLSRTRLGADGIRDGGEIAFLSNLRSLTLSGNHLPSTVGVLLAGSKTFANLQVLDLSENRLGDEGVVSLAGTTSMRNLAYLDLSENLIGDAGANALAASPELEGIVFLNLSKNNISLEAATRLEHRFEERVRL